MEKQAHAQLQAEYRRCHYKTTSGGVVRLERKSGEGTQGASTQVEHHRATKAFHSVRALMLSLKGRFKSSAVVDLPPPVRWGLYSTRGARTQFALQTLDPLFFLAANILFLSIYRDISISCPSCRADFTECSNDSRGVSLVRLNVHSMWQLLHALIRYWDGLPNFCKSEEGISCSES